MERDDDRPDPDASLAQVKAEEARVKRARLKVFFGASPGVGKTFTMLEAARREKLDGNDVVIGIVETHGRSETASLLETLAVLPRRKIEHRGVALEEFDRRRRAPTRARPHEPVAAHARRDRPDPDAGMGTRG